MGFREGEETFQENENMRGPGLKWAGVPKSTGPGARERCNKGVDYKKESLQQKKR